MLGFTAVYYLILVSGDSGDVDYPKPVQADQGIPVYVDQVK
jgi:hypothetical protein